MPTAKMFNYRYSNIGSGGTSHGKSDAKLEEPLRFDENKLREALAKDGVKKYKERFKKAWEELSEK